MKEDNVTLRDRLAMAAITGLLAARTCANGTIGVGSADQCRAAQDAYAMADQMLWERKSKWWPVNLDGHPINDEGKRVNFDGSIFVEDAVAP